MIDNITINCSECGENITLDFWKLKGNHKILCPNCKKFFNLKIIGDSPQKIKNDINKQIKKTFGKLR